MDIDAQLASKRDVIDRCVRAFIHRTGWIEYDDAVQVVSIAAWKILKDPYPGANVDASIIATGLRRLTDELRSGHVTGVTRSGRKHGQQVAMSLNVPIRDVDDVEILDLLVDDTDAYATIDREDAVGCAMQSLPARERFVVWLHYFEDFDQVEIACLLDVSESRISQIITKALSRLREPLTAVAA